MGLFGGGSQQIMSWKVSVDSSDMNKASQNLQGMNKEAGKSPGLFGNMASKLNNFVMGGFALQMVTGAFHALSGAVQDFLKGAIDAENQQAQLNAVLKSTHGMAGITIDDINGMAEAMTRYTAFDDEAIRSSSALLLTFTSVGHTVFKRAQADILDIATAMHEDLQSATIQVGKALQSPQGWTALKRIGVNISKDMLAKAQVLYDTGHAAEAQTMLLTELETEFGGSASAAGKTFAGTMAIIGNRIDDVKKAIGLALLPILTELGDRVLPFIEGKITDAQNATKGWGDVWEHQLKPPLKAGIEIIKQVGIYAGILWQDWQNNLQPAIEDVAAAFAGFTDGAQGLTEGGVLTALNDNFSALDDAAIDVAGHLSDFIRTVLPQLKAAFGDIKLKDIVAQLKEVANFILHNLGPAFKGMAILAAIGYGAFAALIGVIVFLVAKLKELWQRWPPLQQAVHGAGEAIGKFAADIGKRLGPAIKNISFWIGQIMAAIGPLWEAFWPHLQDVLKGVWDVITGIFQIFWSFISGFVKVVLDLFSGNFQQANQDALDAFGGIIDGAKKILGGLIGILWGILQGLGAVVGQQMAGLRDHLGSEFQALLDRVGKIVPQFVDLGKQFIQGIIDGIGNMAGNLASALGSAVHNAVASIPGVSGHVPGFASGGLSSGGLAMVGERGPELVALPAGARVYNNNDTRQIAAASGGGNTYNITVPGGVNGTLAGRQVVRALQSESAHSKVNRMRLARG